MNETNEKTAERGIPMGVSAAGKRVGRSLKWHERQWGSGFLAGVQIGAMVGIGTAIPVAFAAKWLVEAWVK